MIDASQMPAAQGGMFSAVETGWSFGGALTLDDAADVLEASKALPLPATGVVDSAALAVMLALKRRANAEDRTLSLTGLPASLRSLAVVYGVDHYLADATS